MSPFIWRLSDESKCIPYYRDTVSGERNPKETMMYAGLSKLENTQLFGPSKIAAPLRDALGLACVDL